MSIENIEKLKEMMKSAGANKLYVKLLSPNDNSKNQPYFGGDFSVLNILPYGEVHSETLGKKSNFKASVNFYWLQENGSLTKAPHAQFILYPKYPEVRFSGFLKGALHAPSNLMNSREAGRILFLGVTDDGRIIGYVTAPDSFLAHSFQSLGELQTIGVFNEIYLNSFNKDARNLLMRELKRIYLMDWIESKRLVEPGKHGPCVAPNCGGMTLEAELGIMPNSYSEPDFYGWEVKQHGVNNLDRPNNSILTLMTPEPTSGFYKKHGVESFIRKYGYKDKRGREDRFNFGGIHKVGERHENTGLTMTLDGFDMINMKIINPDGGIVLRDDRGNSAAEWKFVHIIEHWKRKHARAVYVPSVKRDIPIRQYRYGKNVRLGIGTDPLKLLEAFAIKSVYYDPGIKLENASGSRPRTKRRSQFRISIKSINTLYNAMEYIDVTV